jgi:membrane protease YdiL (CAAX protease family)
VEVSPHKEETESQRRRKILLEAVGVWVLSVLLIAGFGVLANFIPFISENLLAFVAATFLYLPAWVLWKRHVGLQAYGLTAKPVVAGVLHLIAVIAITFPPFIWGWSIFQSEIKDNQVILDIDRMNRFDRNLEGRPELPLSTEHLHVWIEREQLFLAWASESPIDVSMALQVTKGAPVNDARGLSIHPDGLRYGDRGRLEVKMSGDIRWTRPNAGGISLPLDRTKKITLSTTAPILLGRWKIDSDAPVSTSRTSWWWLLMWLNQLILVALPEEWFFRGYLQKRLDEVWIPKWHILGTQLGWGWLASSLMFALGHLVHNPSPHRLAVFFPSLLFGWLRARTDSVLASTGYHAACNVLAQALVYTLV